ncbi:3-oxoadipate enol-lactonase [Kribbella qitaiheensis]|uniref:3-oxoadipate enol-lactonase n=1 Tax=Kribbella qitaiheensis TaxID=1544730 RepID=UPI0036061E8A
MIHHELTPGPEGAPTVVLSNSLGSTLSMWERQVDALAEHFSVLRYDLRGHGLSVPSTRPDTIDDLVGDVITLLDTLGLGRVHFIGLSLGGMTGLRLAATHPDRVDRLAVLCTSAHLPPAKAWRERATVVRAEGTGAVAEAVVRRWYTEGFHDREPERIQAAVETVAATPADAYAACCEVIATMDLRADLPSISTPTLAIAGADDPATPVPHLQAIAESVQDGQLLVVPQSAHLANDEQPEIITEALLAHLRGPCLHPAARDTGDAALSHTARRHQAAPSP